VGSLKLMRQLLRNQPVELQSVTTDRLTSYVLARQHLGLRHLHHLGCLKENNRAENSHLPTDPADPPRRSFRKLVTGDVCLDSEGWCLPPLNAANLTTLATTVSALARGDKPSRRHGL
jgi:hypothetical protein